MKYITSIKSDWHVGSNDLVYKSKFKFAWNTVYNNVYIRLLINLIHPICQGYLLNNKLINYNNEQLESAWSKL